MAAEIDIARSAPIDGETIVGPEKFWLVVCTEAIEDMRRRIFLTRAYRCVHLHQVDAEREALRLAKLFKGYYFAVVESQAVVRYDQKRGRPMWEESYVPAYDRSSVIGESESR